MIAPVIGPEDHSSQGLPRGGYSMTSDTMFIFIEGGILS